MIPGTRKPPYGMLDLRLQPARTLNVEALDVRRKKAIGPSTSSPPVAAAACTSDEYRDALRDGRPGLVSGGGPLLDDGADGDRLPSAGCRIATARLDPPATICRAGTGRRCGQAGINRSTCSTDTHERPEGRRVQRRRYATRKNSIPRRPGHRGGIAPCGGQIPAPAR